MILNDRKKNVYKEALMLVTVLTLFATAAIAQSEDSQSAHRAAFEACLSSLGIERPERGQRPTAPDDEMREKIDACMLEKGYEVPTHREGRREGGGHRREGSGNGVQ